MESPGQKHHPAGTPVNQVIQPVEKFARRADLPGEVSAGQPSRLVNPPSNPDAYAGEPAASTTALSESSDLNSLTSLSRSSTRGHVTRGRGLFEPFLASQRARQANLLIPGRLRSGRILDIGCGSQPYFLSHTFFKEKFAIDQLKPGGATPGVQWHTLDLNAAPSLPFEENFFSAVTLLAVVEHLDPTALTGVFKEIHRVLIPGGQVIITTPAAWSDRLLHWMARISLVSAQEINEHVYAYTLPLLGWYFGQAGFSMHKIHFGYFELFLNLWACAEK